MLYAYKTAAMQTIQNAATNGYFWMNTGIVEAQSLKKLIDKMNRRYRMKRSRSAYCYDRKKGKPVVKLVTYPCSKYINPLGFHWFLISTLPLQNENLFDIRQQQIIFGMDYHLVRQTKKEQAKPSWTWKMTKERKAIWVKHINEAIKNKKPYQLKAACLSIAAIPHFHGIRMDRKDLWKIVNGTWRRTYKQSVPVPKLPINRFKRSVKIQTVVQVSRFVKAMIENGRSSEDQMRLYLHNLKSRASTSKKQ
jgi:hypothetical protein